MKRIIAVSLLIFYLIGVFTFIHFEKEEIPYGTVTKKTGTGYGVTKSKYEYEDLAKLARERETSIREIREAKKV